MKKKYFVGLLGSLQNLYKLGLQEFSTRHFNVENVRKKVSFEVDFKLHVKRRKIQTFQQFYISNLFF